MSRYLFVADVHLCQEEPAITAGFIRFLTQQAPHCDALYILGDLFEAWIGDDDPNPLHQQIAETLSSLTVPIYFIHGNRDFLVGKQFAKASHMQLLPEEVVLENAGQRAVILHGDTLCTDDLGYQKFRKKVHTPWIQRLFLALPLKYRLNIAHKMRKNSQTANQYKSQQIMDVNPDAVSALFAKYDAEIMIHGHTHRPAIHACPLTNHRQGQRAVLGAWHEKGWMIVWDEQGIHLESFPW